MTRRDPRMRRSGTTKAENAISGQFAPKLIEMLDSPAWQALTRAARRVIDRLDIELANHGGHDNGRLPATYADFVAVGIDRHGVHPAIAEAVALGFLVVTEQGRAGNAEWRRPNLFRLTYRHAKGIPGDGSHEWRRIKTIEEALAIKAKARESANRREAKKALKKKKTNGGKYQFSVGDPPTESNAAPVGVPPTTGSVGNPPLLSISPVDFRGVSRSAPVGSAVASETLGAGVIAAEREKLVALAMQNGRSRAEALAVLDIIDDRDGVAPSSSSVIEPPMDAPPPPPQTDAAAPAGRQMFLLQKWGASPAQARDLVMKLIAAAGPERHSHLDEMFAMVERWPGQSGPAKIAWLRLQVVKMSKWPTYRAQRRMDTRPTGRDAIVAALRLDPDHRASNAELAAATGKTLAAVRALTNWMVKHSELHKIGRGVFTLPQEALSIGYATARAAILALLAGMAGRYVCVAELAAATGKSANAISSTASRMVTSGELLRGKSGFYALPRKVRTEARA